MPAQQRKAAPFRGIEWSFVALGIGLIGTLLAWQLAERTMMQLARNRFLNAAQKAIASVDKELTLQFNAGPIPDEFRVEEFFQKLLPEADFPTGVNLEVFDAAELTEAHMLYDSNPRRLNATSNWNNELHELKVLQIGGRPLTLSFSAPATFGLEKTERFLPVAILWMGILLSILLFGVLCALATSRSQALKLAERMTSELRETERRYADLVEGAPDPIVTLSPLGYLRSLNPTAESMFGYHANELIGKHFLRVGVVEGKFVSLIMKEFALTVTGAQRTPFEVAIRRKDGSRLLFEANSRPMARDGQVLGIQIIFRDITKRKQLEEHQKEQAAELVQANKQLKDMAVLKDEFVAKVSHELRTPLTSIKEGLSLLLDSALGSITANQEDFLKTMDGDIDRLTELINNMLDLSKIEADRMRLHCRRVYAQDLVEAVVRSTKPLTGPRTIRTDFANAPAIFADSHRIMQVLTNLLSNAIKFTPEDGTITVRVAKRDTMVAIEVQDTGPGISQEDLPKLFQKFSQVEPDGAQRPRGTGLGLAVCKELAELHGGNVQVHSMIGHGATFVVQLPIYTTELALRESWREVLRSLPEEEASALGLVLVQADALMSVGERSSVPQLEELAEAVRLHVHRGDLVVALEPSWVVVLAIADAQGALAIVKRLQAALVHSDRLRFGAAVYPQDGTEPHALLERAKKRLGEDVVEYPHTHGTI